MSLCLFSRPSVPDSSSSCFSLIPRVPMGSIMRILNINTANDKIVSGVKIDNGRSSHPTIQEVNQSVESRRRTKPHNRNRCKESIRLRIHPHIVAPAPNTRVSNAAIVESVDRYTSVRTSIHATHEIYGYFCLNNPASYASRTASALDGVRQSTGVVRSALKKYSMSDPPVKKQSQRPTDAPLESPPPSASVAMDGQISPSSSKGRW